MSLMHYISLVIAVMVLSGCQNTNYSQDYLIQHPNLVKKEIEYCQSLLNKTPEQAKRCELVMNAAGILMALLSERQQDPEKFGRRVIDVEIGYVKAKQNYEAAQQLLNDLKNKKMSNTEIETAQVKVAETKQVYEDKRREMKTLLSVIGMSSPE